MKNDNVFPPPFSLHSDAPDPFKKQLLSHLEKLFPKIYSPKHLCFLCVRTPLQLTRWKSNCRFRYFSTASTWFCPVFKWLVQLATSCFSPLKTAQTYFHSNACPKAKAQNHQQQNKQKKHLWSFCQCTVAEACTHWLLFVVSFFLVSIKLGWDMYIKY